MTRGFSLIELMVSLALGSLVLAGAFGLHMSFNRQSQRQERVAEMQQTLRVARQVMERSLRGAGAAIPGGVLKVGQCDGTTRDYYTIQFSESNVYANPKLAFDNVAGDTDADPDWIQVIAGDPSAYGVVDKAAGANAVVNDVSQFATGDLFVVIDTSANHKNCLFEVTQVDNAGGNRCPTCGGLQHNPGQSCINLPPGKDCVDANFPVPAPLVKLTGNVVTFRVDKTNAATPRLMGSFAKLGQPPNWQVIADNVEDLQVALVMKDGRVCGQAGYSVDDPALCLPADARAVRFTLTARGSSPEQGVLIGSRGGVEDEPATAMNDGYLRRTVTAEVQLRNLY